MCRVPVAPFNATGDEERVRPDRVSLPSLSLSRVERMHGEVPAIAQTACYELNGCRCADLPVFLRDAAAN